MPNALAAGGRNQFNLQWQEQPMDDTVSIIGFAAGACTTVAFLPQLIAAWRTRSTRDLSLPTFAIFCLGTLLWLAYGLLTANGPVIAANLITTLIAAGIAALKFRYG
jgi:MtN3 and saliva related transmembrane protein